MAVAIVQAPAKVILMIATVMLIIVLVVLELTPRDKRRRYAKAFAVVLAILTALFIWGMTA